MRLTEVLAQPAQHHLLNTLCELFPGHRWSCYLSLRGDFELVGQRLEGGRAGYRTISVDGDPVCVFCAAAQAIVDELAHPPYPPIDAAAYLGGL